ncbi:MAG TPA: triose-phosphate isomerase [Acidimicrobiales bacterium]|nr:triose-phosphate isomerase [Acidimicrobiales bacterium]
MSARRPVVAGNWKLHHDHVAAVHYVAQLAVQLRAMDVTALDVVVVPPFTDLRSVSSALEDDGVDVALGAQHVSEHDEGAYTGEVAATMLARLGVRVCLVGHSERRRHFCMDDATVGRTVAAVRRGGLVPMLCVGETEAERDEGATEDVLARQLDAGLAEVPAIDAEHLVVAYEPVWAIGTGRSATPEDAQGACAHLRRLADKRLDGGAGALRVLYGGSVDAANAAALVEPNDVDGLLVGGASLDATTFAAVIGAVADCYRAAGRPARR